MSTVEDAGEAVSNISVEGVLKAAVVPTPSVEEASMLGGKVM